MGRGKGVVMPDAVYATLGGAAMGAGILGSDPWRTDCMARVDGGVICWAGTRGGRAVSGAGRAGVAIG